MATQASQLQRNQFNESDYKEFFTRLNDGKGPYPYQTNLARILTQGKSVILRAPTGSGKTWATVAPFIYSCLTQNKLADRLIYALPLRSLASNLHESTEAKLHKLTELQGKVCSSAKNRRYHPNDPFYLGLQMGGQQDDPFFEGDITFTTIDQLLSAYLFAPVSLPARVGNIGAGALIGSFLVFDEIHLLDPERSLGTTVEMLVRLKGLAQFVLMTATMPDPVMEWLAKKLDAEQLSLSDEEVRQLPSHAAKQRSFEWCSSPLSAEDILREHKDRTIAIANTVGRAQELYRDICELVKNKPNPPLVFLLHSRFFPQDRKNAEAKLADYFGPDAVFGNAILISTQVVEAGIDISADVLLTELAPLNSLLQRAGRCARYANRNIGRLLVFDLPTNEKGQLKMGPYRDKETAVIVAATRELLAPKRLVPLLDYSMELKWLERIHKDPDLKALQPFNNLQARIDYVLQSMDGLNAAALPQLVRDTSSVSVIVTSRPEDLQFSSKQWPELLSIPRTSLFKLKDACSQSVEWVLKVPDEIESESNQRLDFTWRVIKKPEVVSWLVAIHPNFARYSEEVGLELGEPSEVEPKVNPKFSPPIPRYSYQKESFVKHARRVAEHGARILEMCPHALRRLKQRYPGIPLRDVHLLACALHDTGKLQIRWQKEAEDWQRGIDSNFGKPYVSEALAHTDFNPERDKGKKWPKFPPHAACGGFAVLPYLMQQFPCEIAVLLCTVITRHHGTHTKELQQFELMEEAAAILEQSLPDSVSQPTRIKLKPGVGDCRRFPEHSLLHLTDKDEWWALYASVVRVLRLADQGSLKD